MIYIRPFKKEDLDGLVTIEQGPEMFTDELKQAIEDSGLAATGTRDGKVVCCAGIHPTSMEYGMLWLRMSEDCKRFRIECARFLKESLKVFEASFGFRQLNAIVKCDFKEGLKLVKFLDFRLRHAQVGDGYNIYTKRIA